MHRHKNQLLASLLLISHVRVPQPFFHENNNGTSGLSALYPDSVSKAVCASTACEIFQARIIKQSNSKRNNHHWNLIKCMDNSMKNCKEHQK